MGQKFEPVAIRLTSFVGERAMVQNMFSGREILPHTQRFNNSSIHSSEKMEGSSLGGFSPHIRPFAKIETAWQPYCYDWCPYRLAYSSGEAHK